MGGVEGRIRTFGGQESGVGGARVVARSFLNLSFSHKSFVGEPDVDSHKPYVNPMWFRVTIF